MFKLNRKIIYIAIMILTLYLMATILYIIKVHEFKNEYSDIINQLKGSNINYSLRSIGTVNPDFDININIPNWDSFWNDLSKQTYSVLGYDSALILDLLQVTILFLTGIGFVNAIIFQGGESTIFRLNHFFFKFYLISFVILIIFAIVSFYRERKNGHEKSKQRRIKEIGTTALLIGGSIIIVPLLVFTIDLCLLVILKFISPFLMRVIFGVDIYNTNSILGEYTLSNIIFNSSFKEQMGDWTYVPNVDGLFSGRTFEIAASIGLKNLGITLYQNEWIVTINPQSIQTVESLNFFMLYISDIVIIVLLAIVAIKITKSLIKTYFLLVSLPLYLAIKNDNNESFLEWRNKLITTLKILFSTIILYLVFSLIIPSLLTEISLKEIDSFREVNWIGMVNIITIISGLVFIITLEKNILKKDKKQNFNEFTSHEQIENETNEMEIYE